MEQACVGDHGTVIDAVAIIHGADRSASLCGHDAHHFLKSYVAANSAHEEDLLRAAVCHRSLSGLCQHGEDRLLKTIAQVFLTMSLYLYLVFFSMPLRLFLLLGLILLSICELFYVGQQAGEAYIHALDYVGEINIL